LNSWFEVFEWDWEFGIGHWGFGVLTYNDMRYCGQINKTIIQKGIGCDEY